MCVNSQMEKNTKSQKKPNKLCDDPNGTFIAIKRCNAIVVSHLAAKTKFDRDDEHSLPLYNTSSRLVDHFYATRQPQSHSAKICFESRDDVRARALARLVFRHDRIKL